MPDTEDDITADACAARDRLPGRGSGHGEITGCHGYTLGAIDRLAYIAVRYRREGYGFGVVSFEDRHAVATAAIAEALCAGDESPPEQALIGAATQAVRRAVRAELSYRGISLADGRSRIPARPWPRRDATTKRSDTFSKRAPGSRVWRTPTTRPARSPASLRHTSARSSPRPRPRPWNRHLPP